MKDQNDKLLKNIDSLNEQKKQYSSIQSDLEKYLDILSQVDRHLKTLIKFLKNVVEQSNDPQIIEHTQRQIKGIENVHKDIKKAIYHKDYCNSESSRVIDNIFSLNDETAKFGNATNASWEHHNRKPEESLNTSGRPSVGTRSQRPSQSKQASAEGKAAKIASSEHVDNEFKHPSTAHPNSSANSRKQKSKENDTQIVKKEKASKVLMECNKAAFANNMALNDVNVSRSSELTMATKAGGKAVDIEIAQKKEKTNKRTQKVKSKEKENMQETSIGKRDASELVEDANGKAKKRARRVAPTPFSAAQ